MYQKKLITVEAKFKLNSNACNDCTFALPFPASSSVWFRQLSRSGACSLMCAAGGPDPNSRVDNPDSGFHPSELGKMSSNQYVVGDRYRIHCGVEARCRKMATCA
jgi:hypothetical protein